MRSVVAGLGLRVGVGRGGELCICVLEGSGIVGIVYSKTFVRISELYFSSVDRGCVNFLSLVCLLTFRHMVGVK